MSLQEITERELSLYGVVSLPTRPGASREFGGRSYTPTELKEAFDRLPRLLAERYNELVRQVAEGDLADALMVTRDGETVTLQGYLANLADRLAEEEGKSLGLSQTDASYASLLEELQGAVDDIEATLDDIDTAPTADSTHLITSGGVCKAIETLDSTLTANITDVYQDVSNLQDTVTFLQRDQVELEIYAQTLKADIDTLYAIAKDTVVAVDTVEDTYSTRETAGGLDIVDGATTTVKMVQGRTRKSNNLIDLSAANGETVGNVAVTVNDYEISFKGTCNFASAVGAIFYLDNLEVGKTYCLRQSKSFTGNDYKIGFTLYSPSTTIPGGYDLLAETADGEAHTFVYASGMYCMIGITTANNSPVIDETFFVMLNEGELPLDFERTDNLFNSTFSGIRSTGKQLLPQFEQTTIGGLIGYPTKALSVGKEYRISANASVLSSIKISETSYSQWSNAFGSDWSASGTRSTSAFNTQRYPVSGGTSPLTLDNKYIFIRIKPENEDRYATAEDIETYQIMIYEGSAEEYSYQPYVEDTYTLTVPVELGAFDYIDIEKQQVVRQTNEVIETEDIFCPTQYKAFEGGTETILPEGQTVTVTQDYYAKVGGGEV